MSVYTIYYQNGAKMMRPVKSRQEYLALRDSEQNRRADKMHMVQMNYSCLPKGVNADTDLLTYVGPLKGAELASDTVGMDIDFDKQDPDYEQKMQSAPELIMSKKDELGLLMLERSASKGYHIVFRRRFAEGIAEGQLLANQERNLRWASDLLGVAFDKGAKDITRVFFTTTADADHLLYLDDALFTITAVGVAQEARRTAEPPGTEAKTLPRPLPVGRGEDAPSASVVSGSAVDRTPSAINAHNSEPPTGVAPINATAINAHNSEPLTGRAPINVSASEPLTYLGIEYSQIIKKYWDLFNDGNEPCEGDRNVKTFELAMSLRSICEYNLDKMLKVIPCYDGLPEEEWRKTIENAVNEPRKGMPWRTRQVLNALKSEKRIEVTGGTRNMPPPMPKRLPPLLRHLTKNVPDYYKPVVAAAVFPPLASHLHGVKFRYWDNTEHEPNLMNVTIGKQSVGKGSIGKPIEYVMADIKLRDAPNRAREAEYKRNNPTNKSKKDPRPTDICIQMVIDNLTDAVFNQRVVDCDNNGQRYVYTRVDEVEALKNVTSKGTVDEVSLLIRKAYDNALHGQERVGPDSVTGIAPLRWNWNASCTPPKARTFFKKAVSDGTVSRLDISTMIVDRKAPDYVPPVFGIYDDQFAEELKPYIDRLNNACGLIECPQATRLAIRMRDGHAKLEELINSDAYGTLSFRANVIAWTKGMVLYIAHGYKWSKEIADFVRWSMDFDMWGKMVFFGDQLEKETAEEDRILSHSGPKNMLDELEDEFTKEDYHHVREMLGKTGDGESTLRVWVKRGYIVWDEVIGKFCKTEAYKSRGFIQD